MTDARFNPDGLVLSENYADTMNSVVLPWLAARREDITVTGDGDKPLFVSRFRATGARGTVLIVHGFTENADKYAELIHSLLRNGYDAVTYDQRGHGRSWRDSEIKDQSLTHVDRFEAYVKDMERVCEAALAGLSRPRLLFAHSMGGAVSALFLETHPRAFDRVVLCAPMIAPNLGGLPQAAARMMCAAATSLGQDRRRVFASRPYSGPEDFDTSCATGRARFDWYDALRVRTPAFQNNGPTYGWTREALRASRMVLAPGAAERIDVPVRVYTAGDDHSVMPDAQDSFTRRLRAGRRALVSGSRHEIYRSDDGTLFPWWRGILDFYEATEREEADENEQTQ